MKILLIIIVISLIWAVYENKFMLAVRRERLGKGVKIAHISDIHKRQFGENNCKIAEKTARNAPDMIFITGDLVSRDETDLTAAEKFLRSLCDISPVYMVLGNHEQSLENIRQENFCRMAERCGAVLIRNNCVSTEIKGRKFSIYGLELPYTVYRKNKSYCELDTVDRQDIENLIGKKCGGEVLLLAHNPLFGKVYAEWGADYTFSGHVHGGVVRLFGKGILSPERKFFPSYSKGVYDISGRKLLVSAGTGKLRLFDPPEIVIYEI